jgi:hypothetical protein
MADEPTYETERDVLRAMLEMHGEHEAPTPRDVLGMQIRMTCARAGLPMPDLGHWPPSELVGTYMDRIAG